MNRRTLGLAVLAFTAGACSGGGAGGGNAPGVSPTPLAAPASSTSSTSTSSSTTSTSVVEPSRPSTSTTSRSRPPAVVGSAAAGDVGGQTAQASWYGAESGSGTANGESFDGSSLTFAHRTLPFGTRVRFCHGGRCVVARCNDRGPFVRGRSFDLSRATFASIASLSSGVITVSWSVVST